MRLKVPTAAPVSQSNAPSRLKESRHQESHGIGSSVTGILHTHPMRKGLDRIDWALDPSRDTTYQDGPSLGTSNENLCERCGAEIVWLRLQTGRFTPFEKRTHPAWFIPREQRWGVSRRDRLAKPAPDAEGGTRVCVRHMPVCPESSVVPADSYLAEIWEEHRGTQ